MKKVGQKISLSQKVKCELVDFIHSTGMNPNDALPTESELTEMLSVSRYTLREALALLEQERIIYKVHGKGTFIRKIPSTIESGLEKLESVTDIIKKFGLEPNTVWCGISEEYPNEEMVKKLKISSTDKVVTFKRIRTANGEFVAYCIDSIPLNYLKFVPVQVEDESMLRFLSREMDINPESCITYMMPVMPPAELLEAFRMEADKPLLMLQQTHLDEEGRAVIFSYDYFNPELLKFRINRTR